MIGLASDATKNSFLFLPKAKGLPFLAANINSGFFLEISTIAKAPSVLLSAYDRPCSILFDSSIHNSIKFIRISVSVSV